MVALKVEETSGVDHPAHLHEGWLVAKASDPADIQRILDAVQTPSEEGIVPEIQKSVEERLAEAEALVAKQAEQIAELTAEPTPEPTPEDIAKALPEPLRKAVDEALTKAAEATEKAALAESTLRKEREARALEDSVAKAAEFETLGLVPADLGAALLKVRGIDADLADSIEATLKAVKAQADTAAIFTEVGKSAAPDASTAAGRLEGLAKSAVDAGTFPTIEQARTEILMSDADLQKAVLAERKG
jgi:hypothetical protein